MSRSISGADAAVIGPPTREVVGRLARRRVAVCLLGTEYGPLPRVEHNGRRTCSMTQHRTATETGGDRDHRTMTRTVREVGSAASRPYQVSRTSSAKTAKTSRDETSPMTSPSRVTAR